MSVEFDKKREEILDEIRDILTNAEALFDEKSESGKAELKKLKESLKGRLGKAKEQLDATQAEAVTKVKDVARQTDALVQDNPYKSIAVAGVVGLLLGVLVGRR